MTNITPYPDGKHLSQAVRDSCLEYVKSNSDIQVGNCIERPDPHDQIDSAAIDKFLNELDEPEFEELIQQHGMKFPLKFDSIASEVNFISLVDLLNFGHGYRKPLKELTGRGAFDTIRQLMMGLYIGGTPLDAKSLSNMTAFQIAEASGAPLQVEKPHETLPITIGEKSAAEPFIQDVKRVMNETGNILQKSGYQDFGSFVIESCKMSTAGGKQPTLRLLLERLVKALPALQDMTVMNGKPLYLFKKVQILAYDLYIRFGKEKPDLFNFADVDELTIFVDNVIPTMLATHYGILHASEAWIQDIKSTKQLTPDESFGIRAGAVVACEAIAARTRERHAAGETAWFTRNGKGLSVMEIDEFIWRKAKVGDLRKLPRFCDRNTVYF